MLACLTRIEGTVVCEWSLEWGIVCAFVHHSGISRISNPKSGSPPYQWTQQINKRDKEHHQQTIFSRPGCANCARTTSVFKREADAVCGMPLLLWNGQRDASPPSRRQRPKNMLIFFSEKETQNKIKICFELILFWTRERRNRKPEVKRRRDAENQVKTILMHFKILNNVFQNLGFTESHFPVVFLPVVSFL